MPKTMHYFQFLMARIYTQRYLNWFSNIKKKEKAGSIQQYY